MRNPSKVSSRLEIKICGLTNLADARLALELGADYLGFVLYPRSPRAVRVEALKDLVAGLPPGTRCVGVFVNESRDRVRTIVDECGLYAAQIHGDESAADFAAAPFRVWRAVSFAGEQWTPRPDDWPVERLVVDAHAPAAYGGTGQTADWEATRTLAVQRELLLAGGLTPGNVAEAIRGVRPRGVDVSSGVEATPGRKDPRALRAFFTAARGV